MSHDVSKTDLQAQTKQLLDGPLKHIRAAALAAALVPLASIAAAPASAQTNCFTSGGVCGTVFNDTNNNGIMDSTETGLNGVIIIVCQLCNGSPGDSVQVESNPDGSFTFPFLPPGTYTVEAQIPTGTQVSPAPSPSPGQIVNLGANNGAGLSVVSHVTVTAAGAVVDFGFFPTAKTQPGTGTPGFWKNHPDAWPTNTITIGGVVYSKDVAISWLERVGKDKTTTMFAQLVSAKLNLMIGNDGSCISSAIAAADSWISPPPTGYGPVGSGVAGGSAAWQIGDPIASTLDAYNNGRLCAPHRQ